MTDFLYLDTETFGLSLDHDIWELGWAINDDPIRDGFIAHDPSNADPVALEVNHYAERFDPDKIDNGVEYELLDALHDFRDKGRALTLVGANPSFDAYRLAQRWDGQHLWEYRFLDISVYAMPLLQASQPVGMQALFQFFRRFDTDVPEPDHTARGDDETLRWFHKALILEYAEVFYT